MRHPEPWNPQERVPPPVAPPLPGPPLLRQDWRETVFLHWPVAPEVVAPLLPAHTRPDVLGGVTHVGVVAFRVIDTRVLGALPTGAFTEVNVRLYTVDRYGRQGVFFLSLDADSLHNVLAARLVTGVRYMWSDVSLRTGASGVVAGAIRRRWPDSGTAGRWRLRITEPIPEPSPMQTFVTARWGLHTRHLGRTRWIHITHQPWRLFGAELLDYGGGLLPSAGIPITDRPPSSVLWSPGADTLFCPSAVTAEPKTVNGRRRTG